MSIPGLDVEGGGTATSLVLGVASATTWNDFTKEGAACVDPIDDTELECDKRTCGDAGVEVFEGDDRLPLLPAEKPNRPNNDRLRLPNTP